VAIYLPVGLISLVLVSHFTKSEPPEKLYEFYTLLNTPVGEEQRLVEAGITVKLGGESQKSAAKIVADNRDSTVSQDQFVEDRLILVDLLSLPKKFSWKRYRVDILGFIAAAAIAGLMILATMLLANIGK